VSVLASSSLGDGTPDHGPVVDLRWGSVFPGASNKADEPFLQLHQWDSPVTCFVGRNGTGKSRAAKSLASQAGGHLLTTDRLLPTMQFTDYGYTRLPDSFKGVPLGERELTSIRSLAAQPQNKGSLEAVETLYALRQQPDVWLRVAAFIRRALGRTIELREQSGYLDPYVRLGNYDYSLFRDEGHGLRELVILLAAIYRPERNVLVVDEPELHLHPAMARLWVSELEKECRDTGRHSVIVTHEPSLVRPKSADDLGALWLFMPGQAPIRCQDQILPVQMERVTASIQQNPEIISQLAFSPRPVLVEGPHDVAALTTALSRTQPPEVVAQTDLVSCGGSGAVAMWFEISRKLGIDVKAVADLDSLFAPEVTRTMDTLPEVTACYAADLAAEPARTGTVVRPLVVAMDKAGVASDPKSRARWLAGSVPEEGNRVRKEKVIEIWRSAGIWLHPQGTLEDVLEIANKGTSEARSAAEAAGEIDDVAAWCAYRLDASGEVFNLLSAMIERIAHDVIEALRLSPEAQFTDFSGANADGDARLAQIVPLGDGRHRLIVRTPEEFSGYWVDFSRETRPAEIVLRPPAL
jgi:hypothetical protein